MKKISMIVLLFLFASVGLVFSLGRGEGEDSTELTGSIRIDGSSTVYPLTEAVAEEFFFEYPEVQITVNYSGTGGGFKKFYIGETHINGASRPIKAKEEKETKNNGIDYIELPVAYDGLSVVVNRNNPIFAESGSYITVEELKKIWEPGSTVQYWSDVREGWPSEKIILYGPGTASGTFDYFTEAINGKSQASRKDFSPNEDDNALVKGVAGNTFAMGYFGYAYYVENEDSLRAIAIKVGDNPAVAPSAKTIGDGTYQPLSRPIFIYVNAESAQETALKTFVEFYLDNAGVLAREVGYVGLPESVYNLIRERFVQSRTGSMYTSGTASSLEELLKQ